MLTTFLTIAGVLDLGVLQGLVFAGLAFSVVLSLLSLDFPDLSIEGTFPLGAALAAVCLAQGVPSLAVFAAAGLAGAVGGVLTGTLHVRFGMSKLLAGICTASIFYTLNLWIMGNRGNLPILDQYTYLSWFETADSNFKEAAYADLRFFFHPAAILGCLLIVLVLKVALDFLLSSEFGVALRGVGQNETAARYYGRSPGFYKMAGLALANACAAMAGALAGQYQGFSDVNMGIGVLVLALVAVILGQEIFARLGLSLAMPVSLTRAALVGVILYQTLLASVLRMGMPPTSLRLMAGLSLVAVVALRHRRRALTFSW